MKRTLFIAVVLLSFLTAGVFAAATEEVDYMAIFVDGHKIGNTIHTRDVEGSQVTTIEEINLQISRGLTVIRYNVKVTNTETAAGKPLGFEMIQNVGGQVCKGTVSGGKIKKTMQNGPTHQDSIVTYPTGALMSEGLRLLQIQKGLTPGQNYNILLFQPTIDEGVPTQIEIGKKTSVDILGRTLELTEVRMSMIVGGQAATEISYVDDQFKTFKRIVPMLGMNLEMIACEKDFALGQDDVVDFLDKLCVASPVAISTNDLKGPITYELCSTTDKPLTLPATDTQTVREIAPGRLEVTVHTIDPNENTNYPYKGKDKEAKKALNATEHLQSKNTMVADLAKRAVSGTDDTLKAAKQIENFVKGYIIKKDLSVGYASAAEIAQTRQGDCTEHAVLAAAMCRAVGIPARVVCGMVYADVMGGKKNIFCAHMWVEVFLNGTWYPIDPTRAPNGFSAAHITLARGDGTPTDFFSLVNTLGCFKIEKVTLPPKTNNQ